MDRPRRALAEEPDDVESYVARRSRGFTPADDGNHLATRAVRAARALEPPVITHPSPESDQLGFSDPSAAAAASPAPGNPLRTPRPDRPDEGDRGRDRGRDRQARHGSFAQPIRRACCTARVGRARGADSIRDKPAAATQRALAEF